MCNVNLQDWEYTVYQVGGGLVFTCIPSTEEIVCIVTSQWMCSV